jgi:hypothetical protein
MIEWFRDEKLSISFDDVPRVCIRYVLPSSTESERKSIEKYPFINKKELKVILKDFVKNKTYTFTIPKGYCYDGASIPKIFWRVIGSNTDNRFLIPALIHDVMCENHHYVDNDREFSSKVFNALLEVSEVNPFKRFLMKNSVDFFQRFCKW